MVASWSPRAPELGPEDAQAPCSGLSLTLLEELLLYSLSLAPGKGDHGCSLPASPQAPPLLNSSVPGCPEPVTPINRGCIHREGAWQRLL